VIGIVRPLLWPSFWGRGEIRLADTKFTQRLVQLRGHFHSITGVLRNALDQAYKEWNRKPFTAIGYGSGGGRAIEHLRAIAVELQMVSTRGAVHIGGSDFMAVFPMGGNKPIEEIESGLLPSAKAALDDLSWWAKGTMAAKAVQA
jgi:NAD(P)H-dependent FMN reductase